MFGTYKVLITQNYTSGKYTLVPIRYEDRYDIMKWRNEQIDVLRQDEILTPEQQDLYFKNTVMSLFSQSQPSQILWSFLLGDELIGYGGLVHINHEEKTAEISFLTTPQRANNKTLFQEDWFTYLQILKPIAFDELHLETIFTYAFDIRPELYKVLEKSGFELTKRLPKEFVKKDKFYDVVIHSCTAESLSIRKATADDCLLYFTWANDEEVRIQSYQQGKLEFKNHQEWFDKRLNNPDFCFYIFHDYKNIPVGQVRIEIRNLSTAVIGISVDKDFRGRGFAVQMLKKSAAEFKKNHPEIIIEAFIKESNKASYHSFINAGFTFAEMQDVENITSYKLIF